MLDPRFGSGVQALLGTLGSASVAATAAGGGHAVLGVLGAIAPVAVPVLLVAGAVAWMAKRASEDEEQGGR